MLESPDIEAHGGKLEIRSEAVGGMCGGDKLIAWRDASNVPNRVSVRAGLSASDYITLRGCPGNVGTSQGTGSRLGFFHCWWPRLCNE